MNRLSISPGIMVMELYLTREHAKDEFVGTITDIHPESTPQLYFARTILPIDGFYCTLVSEKDIIHLASSSDVERLTNHPFNDACMTDDSGS